MVEEHHTQPSVPISHTHTTDTHTKNT